MTRQVPVPSTLSVIAPAYNEAANLPQLYERLQRTMAGLDVDWEWIVVDDHSSDATFDVLSALAARDPRVRVIRLARNHGSFAAIACALRYATGDCAVVLAADLQDPPEVIPELLAKWREGSQVVWAVRRSRACDKARSVFFARLYYFLMRHVVGIKQMPATGADFFLIDRRVVDALRRCDESNVSILNLIAWMGFAQERVHYDRQPRLHGRSGWSLEKKLKLVADSVTAFSYLPIRMMSLLGILLALGGCGLAVFIVLERLFMYDAAYAGFAMIMTVMLLGFGFVMTFLGILGEYLWRTFDQVRGRPRYIIEQVVNGTPCAARSGQLSDRRRRTGLQNAHVVDDLGDPVTLTEHAGLGTEV